MKGMVHVEMGGEEHCLYIRRRLDDISISVERMAVLRHGTQFYWRENHSVNCRLSTSNDAAMQVPHKGGILMHSQR
jgi:hypothetical protein